MAIESKIKRLADAGLLDPDKLQDDDRALLEQLTEEEVTVLIQIVTRLYPGDRSLVKLGDLHDNAMRIYVPL